MKKYIVLSLIISAGYVGAQYYPYGRGNPTPISVVPTTSSGLAAGSDISVKSITLTDGQNALDIYAPGNINAVASVDTNGNLTATKFIGDGSGLTGISASNTNNFDKTVSFSVSNAITATPVWTNTISTNTQYSVIANFSGSGPTNRYFSQSTTTFWRGSGNLQYDGSNTITQIKSAAYLNFYFQTNSASTLAAYVIGPSNENFSGTIKFNEFLQTNGLAASSGGGSGGALDAVTNSPGYTPLAFYLPSTTTYTTNTTPTLADTSPLGQANNLTNLGAASSWPVRQAAALNGHDTLLFNGSSAFLRSDKLTNGQPYEITLVMRWNAVTNNATRYIWITTNSAAYASQSNAGKHVYRGFSTTLTGSDVRTNKWMIWTYYSDSTSAGFALTNNVTDVTGTSLPTPKLLQGFILGGTAGNFGPLDVAACVIYPTNLTAIVRSNVYSAFTNYFKTTL